MTLLLPELGSAATRMASSAWSMPNLWVMTGETSRPSAMACSASSISSTNR